MTPSTLSLPLVLADADADAAVVAGMASAIPAASSAPVTPDFMVPPGRAGTAHDRGAADPSRPRKRWPEHWPAWVWTLARAGQPRGAVLIGWRLVTAARPAPRVPTTCRRPFLYSRKGLLTFVAGTGFEPGTYRTTCCSVSVKPRMAPRMGKPPSNGRKAADLYASLLAAGSRDTSGQDLDI